MQQNETIAIIVMLASSACYALSYVLQHKGTQASIGAGVENPGVARLIKNPIWLIGIILFGTSFLLHIVALSFGSVGVVQPLIVTELIFIPPFAALISKAKIHARDWVAILAVAVGLAVFLIVGAPTEGDEVPSTAGWVITFVVFYGICGVLFLIGTRLPINPRAAISGTAVGFINAALAIFAKGAFESGSGGGLFTNPLTYVTILVALSLVVLTAIAFRTGPITTSSPAMIATTPIVSVIASVILFGETLRLTPVTIIVIIACVIVVAGGVFALTQSEAVHAALDDSVEAEIGHNELGEVEHTLHEDAVKVEEKLHLRKESDQPDATSD
mgnify:FL=1